MRIVNWLVLGACAINCIAIDLLIWSEKFAINNILDVLEIIMIIINFIFVVWVYFKDDKKDERIRNADKKRYWYHEVLIQPNLKNVQELYAECINMGDELQKSNCNIKQVIRKIKDKKNNVDNTLGYMLMAYDKKLYKVFNNKLLNFEDEITQNCIVELFNRNISRDEYISKVKKLEAQLIKTLMEHDLYKI